jgi:hypothetical protein
VEYPFPFAAMRRATKHLFDVFVTVVCLMLPVGCSSSGTPMPMPNKMTERDFTAHPAIHIEATPADRVWVVSDIHGGYDRLIALLQGQGLIDGVKAWTGGTAHLYVLGDMIDKYKGGLPAIRLLRDLQVSAAAAGGKVVVTMGNHEAEFFVNPLDEKAGPFVFDLVSEGLDPAKVAAAEDDIGAWLRDLPFGIKDGEWFFSHAGRTGARSLEELGAAIEADVRANKFAAAEATGPDSVLEATLWWETTDPVATVEPMLAALPAKHLVFGHDPGAIANHGSLGELVGGRIFPVDVGMSPAVNYSLGALLLIERSPSGTIVSAGFPAGEPAVIFQE